MQIIPIKRFVIILGILALLVVSSSSRASDMTSCVANLVAEDGSDKFVECLQNLGETLEKTVKSNAQLREQLENLSAELNETRNSAVVPRGTIVLSRSKCSDLKPGKWANFDEAQGRFIISTGAFTDKNKLTKIFKYGTGDNSGEYAVKLSEAQMPRHRHAINTGRVGPIHDGLGGSANNYGIEAKFDNPKGNPSNGFGIVPDVLEARGGKSAHNNIPPYFAMHLCTRN